MPKKHTAPSASPTKRERKTFPIKIIVKGNVISYDPPIPPNKPLPVLRKDRLQWSCEAGAWTAYFKGMTPLVDNEKDKNPLGSVSAASGLAAGGVVAGKDSYYKFGVIVYPDAGGGPLVDDPEIIVEGEAEKMKGRQLIDPNVN